MMDIALVEAEKLIGEGSIAQSQQLLIEYLQDHYGDKDALTLLAFSAKQAGDFEGAGDTYIDIIKDNPNHVQAYFGLGAVRESEGRIYEALALWLAVKEMSPAFAPALHMLDKYWSTKGAIAGAKHELKRLRNHANRDETDAICALGYAHQFGLGEAKNPLRAAQRFEQGANLSSILAGWSLTVVTWKIGMCYHLGYGVEQNDTTAVNWFRIATQRNSAPAQESLAYMFFHGLGVEKDVTKALRYWNKSLNNGNAVAAHNLGILYLNGEFVPGDRHKAKELFTYGANNNVEGSKTVLEWMRAKGV